jgi:hypothetical protein
VAGSVGFLSAYALFIFDTRALDWSQVEAKQYESTRHHAGT